MHPRKCWRLPLRVKRLLKCANASCTPCNRPRPVCRDARWRRHWPRRRCGAIVTATGACWKILRGCASRPSMLSARALPVSCRLPHAPGCNGRWQYRRHRCTWRPRAAYSSARSSRKNCASMRSCCSRGLTTTGSGSKRCWQRCWKSAPTGCRGFWELINRISRHG